MYAFPKITISQKAIQLAESSGMAPDEFYCQELLENVGVVTLPGKMFGQKKGTFHLRTTLLPSEEVMGDLIKRWGDFHEKWVEKYGL